MSRTLLLLLVAALVAAPVAVAQPHGPPPGYTDPVAYAQDHADREVAAATADPLGYVAGKDPAAEAEHAAWLACWTAYEAAGHALDAACAPFFLAPQQVDAPAEAVTAEVTETLNATGVPALAGEALDIVNDTVADPASALDQAGRLVDAIVAFVEDLVGVVLDALGLGAMALGAGLLGGLDGLLHVAGLPLDGLRLAGDALATAAGAIGSALALAGGQASQGASAVAGGIGAALAATAQAIGSAATSTVDGVGSAISAVGQGVASAADAVQGGVADAVHRVTSLLDGKPEPRQDRELLPKTPRTGTSADGLLDGLLGTLEG